MNQTQNRSMFDWITFSLIHIVLIGGICFAGFAVYGPRLGVWVAASAIVAGFASMYTFAKETAGETLMKIWLGLSVAANAGYLVHNGARSLGVEFYNDAQVRKFESAMTAAAQARSRRVASAIGLSAQEATELEKVFDDGVALIASILAFLELASAIVIFSIASRRSAGSPEMASLPAGAGRPEEFPESIEVKPTGPLPGRPDEGKVFRR